MQIFVDADACPVVDIIEKIAEKYNIKTTLLCDTKKDNSHIYQIPLVEEIKSLLHCLKIMKKGL